MVEPLPTRDHTELMLAAAGAHRAGRAARSGRPSGSSSPRSRCPATSRRPRFIVAATLLPGSELTIHDVGLNPTRTGPSTCSRGWARGHVFNRAQRGGEPWRPRGHPAELVATAVGRRGGAAADRRAAAVRARGSRRARREPGRRRAGAARKGNGPSRDRDNFATSPGRAHRKPSRWLRGERGTFPPKGGGMSSDGDHRIAMLGVIAGLLSRDGVELQDPQAVAVSFPGFFELLDSVTQR